MVIIGGLGSITGSVLGAFVLTFLPELFRDFFDWRLVVYGLVVIVAMIARPQGLLGGKEFSIKGIIKFFKKIANKLSSKNKAKKGEEDPIYEERSVTLSGN